MCYFNLKTSRINLRDYLQKPEEEQGPLDVLKTKQALP
jgi:hypothetical protein